MRLLFRRRPAHKLPDARRMIGEARSILRREREIPGFIPQPKDFHILDQIITALTAATEEALNTRTGWRAQKNKAPSE